MNKLTRASSDDEIIKAAKQEPFPDVDFDDDALVSRGEDPGAFVQAWVWVDFDAEDSEDDDDEHDPEPEELILWVDGFLSSISSSPESIEHRIKLLPDDSSFIVYDEFNNHRPEFDDPL